MEGAKSKADAKGRKGKAGKDPNKPKRAPSAFFVFMDEFCKEFKENKSVAAVGKAAGERRVLTMLLLCTSNFGLGMLFTDQFGAMPDLQNPVVA